MERAKLNWNIQSFAGGVRVALDGALTRGSGLDSLAAELSDSREIYLDLANIRAINSMGVLEWLKFVKALEGKTFVLQQCSVPVVQQLNMVSLFLGAGSVTSVFAPYYCRKCNVEERRLILLDRDIPSQLDERVTCPKCDSEMEFDDLLEQYESLSRFSSM